MNSRDYRAQSDMSVFLPGAVFRYRVGIDGVGRLEHMTEACFEIWELDRNQVEQDMASLWAMVDPMDLEPMRESVQACALDLRDWDHQWRITTRSGKRKWLRGLGRPLRDADGSLVWHVLVVDQSHSKVAQEARRSSEERFRQLIDAIPNVAVQGYDAQLICRFWNAASERLYGYTAQEAIGSNLLDLIIPEPMKDAVVEATRKMLASGQAIPSEELTLRHKSGADVHVYSGHVLLDHASGSPSFFCIDFDLSERKAAEEAQRQLEMQLRQAQKMEALGTLAGGIAHDFNNILAAVLGNASLALEQLAEPTELRESIGQIQQAARRARAVVRQILAFARKETTQKAPIDLLPVIEEACSLLRATAPPGVSLQVSVGPDIASVMADGTQMEQVILNLGTNAMHAVTHRRNALVRITLDMASRRSFLAEPGWTILSPSLHSDTPGVWLRVHDNGHGMTEETALRIFEPFFTTKDRSQGTGLGLSVVHGILKDHGAGLTLWSAPDQGTCFHLWLPPASGSTLKKPEGAPAERSTSRGPLRLLYVDDDAQINDFFARACVRDGHHAHVMSDPQQALDHVQRHGAHIDLAIFDHNMPTISGVALLAQVRQACPTLPCALVSAVVDDALKALAIESGAAMVVEKSEHMLDELLEGLLSRSS